MILINSRLRGGAAGQLSWSAWCSVAGALNASGPAEVVGAFQGARDRENLYRPTLTCLMKDTRQPFCPVCQQHMSRSVAGG